MNSKSRSAILGFAKALMNGVCVCSPIEKRQNDGEHLSYCPAYKAGPEYERLENALNSDETIT